MKYEWYADAFFLMNFLMDSAGLLACAAICNRRVRVIRILAVSAVSVLVSMLLLFFMHRFLRYRLLVQMVLNPLMAAAVFRPNRWSELLRETGCVYLVFLIAGGLQESIYLQTGMSAAAGILVSGLWGIFWYVIWQIRQRVYRYICVADLWMDGEQITVEAYYDSGNLLRDPEDNGAVSIVREDVIPEAWREINAEKREIRYRTLNDQISCMQVITLDKIEIYRRGTTRTIDTPKIGLRKGEVMQIPGVQMILHNSLL